MELTTMSQSELNRLETLQRVLDNRLSVVDAAEHLSLSLSQVHRLITRYKQDGADLWHNKKRRKNRIHQPRNRRDRFGELVQIDGSHHPWFEDRGSKCALLVYVDDATSKLLHLRFAQSENAFDYFHAVFSM